MPAMRKQLILLGLVVLLSAAALVAGDKASKSKRPATSSTAPMQMEDDKRIVHALNRFTFGMRPGDVERVRAVGLDKWFDQQLHPDKINDDAIEARLAPFRTLKMSTREMVENFPPPQVLKAVENGRMSMPHDPGKRAIYESRMAEYEQRQQKKEEKAAAGANANLNNLDQAAAEPPTAAGSKDAPAQTHVAPNDPAMTPEQRQQQKRREDAMYADIDGSLLLQMPPEARYKAILKMPVDERLDLARTYKGEKALQLVDGMKPEQRETIQAIVQPQAVVGGELSEAKLLRAIYSDRQLEEVMSDFWFNHFNVFIGKGPDRYMITAYERDVIRPHVLGKFKDLLVATAKSPAMLFYLDNWQSVGPNSQLAIYGQGGRPRGGFNGPFARQLQQRNKQQQQNRPSGLNENYAREIMELHTLGVDGGYTQKDVTELARVLTGWTIDQRTGAFIFRPQLHDA